MNFLILAIAIPPIVWGVACWLAPYVLTLRAREVSPAWVPGYLRLALQFEGITLLEAPDIEGYAFSCLLGFRRVIVVNASFLRFAMEPAREFVLAHELAHHMLRHVEARLACNILRLTMLHSVRRWLAMTEHRANTFAQGITGHPPTVVWGPVTVAEAKGLGNPTEEERA